VCYSVPVGEVYGIRTKRFVEGFWWMKFDENIIMLKSVKGHLIQNVKLYPDNPCQTNNVLRIMD